MIYKTCKQCQIEKSLDNFSKSKACKDGKNRYCRDCLKQKKKKRQEDPNFKVKGKTYRLFKLYGISFEEYSNILKSQDYKCKLCGTLHEKCYRGLVIDHCHKTNKIRGLLCLKCNTAIGNFNENTIIMKLAITYLNSF